MFGRRPQVHVHNHGSITENRTVVEKRAPTDESVRLLREMEAAARDQIKASVRLDPNEGFTGVLHDLGYDIRADEHRLAFVYEWRGQRRAVESRSYSDNSLERVLALRDAIAKDIANAVLEPALRRIKL